jgi:predicted dehydrogenase
VLRIGILGASGIAPAAIIDPANRRNDAVIVGIAARNGESARAYAANHGIERSYDGYRTLLADPDIDLVYNSLPPSEHAEWSIAALEAGKNVLCEKPFAMNAVQARRMNQAAKETGQRLIEAFHDRYHPLSHELDEIVLTGGLGTIISVHGDFVFNNPFDPLAIRHDPALGGGALMDLGCYPVHWVRALTKEEPRVVEAVATLNPLGADMSMDANLAFPSGIQGRITASMHADAIAGSTLNVVGSRGTLRVKNLVFPSAGHSISQTIDGVNRAWTVRGAATYDHQLEAIIGALASGEQLPTEGDDPVENMVVVDSIYEAAGITRNYL